MVTDLHITGKPAQFGRGVIQDVSDKLLNQFVACLEEKLQGPGAAPEVAIGAATAASEGGAEIAPTEVSPAALAASGGEAGGAVPLRAAPATPPSPAGGEDALDLGATVLPVYLKTYWKQALGLVLVLLVLRRLLRRR